MIEQSEYQPTQGKRLIYIVTTFCIGKWIQDVLYKYMIIIFQK